MSDYSDLVEPDDLLSGARGRAAFCRDRGEIKTPGILDAMADRIEALTTERDAAIARAEKAEAALREAKARLAEELAADLLTALVKQASGQGTVGLGLHIESDPNPECVLVDGDVNLVAAVQDALDLRAARLASPKIGGE